jgi:hypothetical protein
MPAIESAEAYLGAVGGVIKPKNAKKCSLWQENDLDAFGKTFILITI